MATVSICLIQFTSPYLWFQESRCTFSLNCLYIVKALVLCLILTMYGEVVREKNMVKRKSQCNSISVR